MSTATEIDILLAEHSLFKEQVAQLTEQLEWFKRQLFGKKSERLIADENQFTDKNADVKLFLHLLKPLIILQLH